MLVMIENDFNSFALEWVDQEDIAMDDEALEIPETSFCENEMPVFAENDYDPLWANN